jgi:DnaJ family protein C protein 7
VACLQMEALMRARPGQGAQQVVAESARWLRKSSDNPDLLCVRGKALYGTGQLEAALKHFTEALRQDPDHTESRRMRNRVKEFERVKAAGNAAFSSGKYAEAIEAYTQGLAIDPENVDLNLTLFTNRATARFKLSDYKGAIDDCNQALDAQPRHMKALLRRAACKLELEDYKGAIDDYETAQSYEPDDQSIRQSLRNAKIEYKKSQRKDLYKVLGVTKRATDHEIKKAYKKMAMQCHPDRLASASEEEKVAAAEKFKEVGEAFEVLSDPQKKQAWDQGQTLDEINGNGGGGRGGGGIDPSDIFRMYSGGGGRRGGFAGF